MLFSFEPLNDEEIQNIKNEFLLKEGIYSFQVKDVLHRVSQAGNPMLEIKLGVFDEKGHERTITDYLVSTPKMTFKIKHFCETLNLDQEYAKGSFNTEKCIGHHGKVLIGIQKGNAKEDGSGYYADKNNVKDYIKQEEVKDKIAFDPRLNDDIKF